MTENRELCKSIATELEAYCNGEMYRCPECGEVLRFGNEVGKEITCPHCGEDETECDFEQLSICDYFGDALDIEYRIGSDFNYRSVCIMITCGGPNIYIDTESNNVELYWWNERESYPIDLDVILEINDFFEEMYRCR